MTEKYQLGGIDWRVLTVENNKVLLISEEILEKRTYNAEQKDITWEDCTLRAYLNNEFYNKLGAEKSAIAEMRNNNPDNLWYGTSGGNVTTDKIFLLSLEEVDKYFGNSGDYASERRKDSNGKADISGYYMDNAYNSTRIANYGSTGGSWWWLRSPGFDGRGAAGVRHGGIVTVFGDRVIVDSGGVRPALWLNL